jgi:hypothetical protein
MEAHYFAKLWHFCMDDLLQPPLPAPSTSGGEAGGDEEAGQRAAAGGGGGVSPLEAAGWRLQGGHASTKQLAMQRYGMDTYVALYGGAEFVFAAVPCDRRA